MHCQWPGLRGRGVKITANLFAFWLHQVLSTFFGIVSGRPLPCSPDGRGMQVHVLSVTSNRCLMTDYGRTESVPKDFLFQEISNCVPGGLESPLEHHRGGGRAPRERAGPWPLHTYFRQNQFGSTRSSSLPRDPPRRRFAYSSYPV